MIKLLLATLASLFIHSFVYSQQNHLNGSVRYIKIVIDSDISAEAQSEITHAFLHINGVQTSRMDNTTRTYLGIYKPSEILQEQTFTNWFTNHGYTIQCYYDAFYTPGGMINLSKNNCH